MMMGILFVIFAIAMSVATFIENDYGAAVAYKMVYGTNWFELALFLLCVNLIGQLFTNNLFRKEKLAIALFHIAFIIMIIGAGITRYFGWEGVMSIREGESQDVCYSLDKIIGYDLKDSSGNTLSSFSKKYNLTSVTADKFKTSVTAGNEKYSLELSRIIPNAEESITPSPTGEPIISMTVTRDMATYETVTLRSGERKDIFDISIGLDAEDVDVNVKCDGSAFYATAKGGLSIVNMMQGMQAIDRKSVV